jgi:hypothetical protein
LLRLDKGNKLKAVGREVKAGKNEEWEEDVLQVPQLPVSGTIKLNQDKKSVNIEYFLKVNYITVRWFSHFP